MLVSPVSFASRQFLSQQRKPPRFPESRPVVDPLSGIVIRPEEPGAAESRRTLRFERAVHQDLPQTSAALRRGHTDRAESLVLVMGKRDDFAVLHRGDQPTGRITG